MATAETGLLTRNPWVARRPLTVAEYHRMGEVGSLSERDRVELIEGELVARPPTGSNHDGSQLEPSLLPGVVIPGSGLPG